jgi:dienelactone hydrolase
MKTNEIAKRVFLFVGCCSAASRSWAQSAEKVVDIPTRQGVTQRMLVQLSKEPKAAVVLLPGGHGGLQITTQGTCKWGANNFLVRSRQLFADAGLAVAVVDAPSDRQSAPYLSGFRTSREHVADIKATIAWLRKQAGVPVWLVGTSRGTESAAFAATQLSGADAPDGIVLTSTILTDTKETPVTAMPLAKLRIPVLVVHHEQDGCNHCAFADVGKLMEKLSAAPKKQLLSFKGGENRGDPCEAFAYHGFNGLERDVVKQIANWIVAK